MPSQSEPDWSQLPIEMQESLRELGKHIFALPRGYVQPSITEMLGDGVDARDTESRATPKMYLYTCGDDDPFSNVRAQIAYALLRAPSFNRGAWQTLNVSQSAAHATRELRNVQLIYDVPRTYLRLRDDLQPDLPWADRHFDERVGRESLNPAPSYQIWPHHNGSAERHVDRTVFSHTYPERFWPKYAGEDEHTLEGNPNAGIRFEYGDLDGVVGQLVANPLTRQAVLPVWFPEDTGATERRVPCSLFYHFQNDGDGRLDCWYSMRACDFVRHFHNDVYLAGRLVQWVCSQLAVNQPAAPRPGTLHLTIANLHLFEGDVSKVTGDAADA